MVPNVSYSTTIASTPFDKLDDRAARPRVVDVPNVETRAQLGAAAEHALQKRTVGAVVALALAVAGAVGESGSEQEEDVHLMFSVVQSNHALPAIIAAEYAARPG
jgi:hypothetical protein